MRIGIDGRFLIAPESGHGRYSLELIKNLSSLDKENDYFVFVRKGTEDFLKKDNFHFVEADIVHYSFSEQLELPKIIDSYSLDLMHFVHFNRPYFLKTPTILTIHDLTLTRFPNPDTTPLRRLAYNHIFAHSVKVADKVIAISQFTRDEILSEYKINPERIAVIYEAVDKRFRKINNKTLIEHKLKRFNITKPYLLYVGQLRPHKNLLNLLEAFYLVLQQHPKFQLVIAGKKSGQYAELLERVKQLGIADSVVFTDFVPEADLPVLYNGATATVMPSLMEGFGLPPLESMSCGVPVVGSNISSIPEIGGEAINYFDPYDIKDMANKIGETLSSKRIRARLVEKGDEQVKKFSWVQMAKETLQEYSKILK